MNTTLKLSILFSFLFIMPGLKAQTTVFEQEKIQQLVNQLPPPKVPSAEAVSVLCAKARTGDESIVNDLKSMSGVQPSDDRMKVKAKVQNFWNIYFDKLGCSDEGLNRNFLKIALFYEHGNIIDLLVSEFNIDINLKDPSDMNTLFDFSLGALESMTQLPYTITKRISYFDKFVNHLRSDLKAKRAVDYTTPKEQKQIDSIIKTLPPLKQPSEDLFAKLCYRVDATDLWYKKDLEELAGVLKTDSRLVVKAKVQRLWNTQLVNFGCDSSGFSVQYGNILKFAVHRGYSLFVDSVIDNYALNINKKDPSDDKTVLDFVLDEIGRISKIPGQKVRVVEFTLLYAHLKNNLGAKHASELK